MYNVIRLLISLTLLCMIRQADQASKPYFCDEKDFNEIGDQHVKIHRFAIHRDVVYVVLEEKVIFFRSPRIHKIVTSSGHRFSYLSSLPFEVKNRYKSKGIGKLVGIVINSTAGNEIRVEQIYSSKLDETPMTDLRELKFDGPVPAVETGNSAFFQSKENYSDYLVKFENRLTILAFQYVEFELTVNLTDKQSGSSVQRQFSFPYDVEMAVFYADNQSLDNTLLELDEQRNVHIKEFDIKMISKSLRSMPIEVSVPLVDLLNCHRRLTTFDQLKGLFYDERQQVTYLFANHFYTIIYEDLVKGSFFIDYKRLKAYDENELDYEFDNEERDRIVLENTGFVKWIKAERANAYLTTFDQVFRISVGSSNQIQLKQIEKPLLPACLRQTLAVDGVLFCFHSTSYYRLTGKTNQPAETFKIKDLFASAPFRHFDRNERLEFIFNYKDEDRVVFMTEENYFLLYYDFFSVDKYQNLIFDFQNRKKLVAIKKNCMFSAEGAGCRRSDVVGDEDRLNPAFYIFGLLPVIAVVCVVGICLRNRERGAAVSPKRKAFELKQIQIKQLQERKASVSPRGPPPFGGALDSSISQTDEYSQSKKSLKSSRTFEIDVSDKLKRPKTGRRMSSIRRVKAMPSEPKRRKGSNR